MNKNLHKFVQLEFVRTVLRTICKNSLSADSYIWFYEVIFRTIHTNAIRPKYLRMVLWMICENLCWTKIVANSCRKQITQFCHISNSNEWFSEWVTQICSTQDLTSNFTTKFTNICLTEILTNGITNDLHEFVLCESAKKFLPFFNSNIFTNELLKFVQCKFLRIVNIICPACVSWMKPVICTLSQGPSDKRNTLCSETFLTRLMSLSELW